MNSKILSLIIVGILELILGTKANHIIFPLRPDSVCERYVELCESSNTSRIVYNEVTKRCEESARGGCAAHPSPFPNFGDCLRQCEWKHNRCRRRPLLCEEWDSNIIVYRRTTNSCIKARSCPRHGWVQFESLSECEEECVQT